VWLRAGLQQGHEAERAGAAAAAAAAAAAGSSLEAGKRSSTSAAPTAFLLLASERGRTEKRGRERTDGAQKNAAGGGASSCFEGLIWGCMLRLLHSEPASAQWPRSQSSWGALEGAWEQSEAELTLMLTIWAALPARRPDRACRRAACCPPAAARDNVCAAAQGCGQCTACTQPARLMRCHW